MTSFKWMFTLFYVHTDLIIIIFFIFIAFPASYCVDDVQFSKCKNSFNCGKLQDIGYPFWAQGGKLRPQFCGHQWYGLECEDDGYPLLDIDNQIFRLLHVNESSQMITVKRTNFLESGCPENPIYNNSTVNEPVFGPNIGYLSIFYGCPFEISNLQYPYNFSCKINGEKSTGAFYANETFSLDKQTACSISVEVPVPQDGLEELSNGNATLLGSVLNREFDATYNARSNLCTACNLSGGICGSNPSSPSQFACLCHDQPYEQECQDHGQDHGNGMNLGLKFGIGFGALVAGILLTCAAFFFYQRRNKKRYASSYLSRNISSEPSSSMTDVENMGRYFGVNIFTYNELEEATNNFDSSKELGDGGFGTVYYGKLRDGRVVAVKRLYENNYKRVEQFMNEVEILTRLRHQNLVALYGCTSRHSRELLLVYEYIPNGTVADHLHGERAKPGSVPWSIRMNIAIETACALKYLHASDIIHRDVKTNNILLDNNFCVKVADFGLSRLFPNDVTHISTAPQGTPGYVDPEYHQCYQLTDRSDVYSFGVVLMELISSMPAVDISRHRHEINLSNMAINKIQNHALHELVDPYLGFESDNKVRKMISAVAELAFQCLQNEKEMRPSMEEVLEVLKDIQSKVYNNEEKAEEVLDIPGDNVVLLKSCPLPYSPNSVTATWISTSTTPNASG